MATFTERQALRQRMEEIRQERRDLNNEYNVIFDRLRELDEIDGKEVDVDSVVGALTEAVSVLKGLVPNIPAEALIRQVATIVNNNEIHIEQPLPPTEVAPGHVIREQQLKDSHTIAGASHKQIRTSSVIPILKDILLDNGGPMKSKEIRQQVEVRLSYSYTSTAFNAVLNRAMEQVPEIEKVSHGYYQYRK